MRLALIHNNLCFQSSFSSVLSETQNHEDRANPLLLQAESPAGTPISKADRLLDTLGGSPSAYIVFQENNEIIYLENYNTGKIIPALFRVLRFIPHAAKKKRGMRVADRGNSRPIFISCRASRQRITVTKRLHMERHQRGGTTATADV